MSGTNTVNWTYTDENGTTTGGSYTVDNTLTDQANTAFVVWLIVIFLSVCGSVSYCAINKVGCFAPSGKVTISADSGLLKPLTMGDIEEEKKWRKNNL
jgi:hypothetical protein